MTAITYYRDAEAAFDSEVLGPLRNAGIPEGVIQSYDMDRLKARTIDSREFRGAVLYFVRITDPHKLLYAFGSAGWTGHTAAATD